MKMQDGGELRTPIRTAQQGQLDGAYDVVLLTCTSYDLDDAHGCHCSGERRTERDRTRAERGASYRRADG
ncbi:hypothetical protein ACNJX9_39035 [Bradyrhizobium sp. DASA03076]|uniref:hypothetical protein n=1 Tax=Bradyrhizobium sp. BLXBL-03 TaxID=3395916 RepID=UPI003F6E5E64